MQLCRKQIPCHLQSTVPRPGHLVHCHSLGHIVHLSYKPVTYPPAQTLSIFPASDRVTYSLLQTASLCNVSSPGRIMLRLTYVTERVSFFTITDRVPFSPITDRVTCFTITDRVTYFRFTWLHPWQQAYHLVLVSCFTITVQTALTMQSKS